MIAYFLIAWILYTLKAPFWVWVIFGIGAVMKAIANFITITQNK